MRSQIVILKMNINMTDITEKTENGEPVTNRDQLVVVDNIESLIKVIRGQQVMLDKDLATLYGVETRTLNQAVKRNIQRFPSDFRFQLTMEECSKSQIVTLNAGRGQKAKRSNVPEPMNLACDITKERNNLSGRETPATHCSKA